MPWGQCHTVTIVTTVKRNHPPAPNPSQLDVNRPDFEAPANTTVTIDGLNFLDAEFTVVSRVTTCGDRWAWGVMNGRIHGVNVGHKPEGGVASASEFLTGTVHVRFNSIQSRDEFLEYFANHTVMHYNRYLRARMSETEMMPRKAFDSSYDQRAWGACKFGERIYECISQRRKTIIDRIEELLPHTNRMHYERFSYTQNWTDNVVRESLAQRGEEFRVMNQLHLVMMVALCARCELE